MSQNDSTEEVHIIPDALLSQPDEKKKQPKAPPFSIEFENLSYSVVCKEGRLWNRRKYEKLLINDVSGAIVPGKLTALMGPSGAGKSTLLDILAGRKTQGIIKGKLIYNGAERTRFFKRYCGYVEQSDILLGTLTPRELLSYTALMRLPSTYTPFDIDQQVDRVLGQLGLAECADTVIGDGETRGISGGQAKRVNIAIELLTSPSILFLDEPTSGLDSSTSLDVMKVVRDICKSGISVVCTLHQPSVEIFDLFDNLLLLVGGETVYNGPANKAVAYFGELGYKCDPDDNPAEFLIDLTGFQKKTACFDEEEGSKTRYFAEIWKNSLQFSDRKKSAKIHNLESCKHVPEEDNLFSNHWIHNTHVLVQRIMRGNQRDSHFLLKKSIATLILGLAFLSVYFGSDKNEQGVRNIQSLLMLSNIFFIFGANEYVGQFVANRVFGNRERAAATYQVSASLLSTMITDSPYNLLKAVIWTTCIWWGIGFPYDFWSYLFMVLTVFVLSEIGHGFAFFFASLSPSVEAASALMNIFPFLFIMFSGFWIKEPQIPHGWIWAYYLSFANYSLSAMIINAFDGTLYTKSVPNQFNNGTINVPYPGDQIIQDLGVAPHGFLSSKWGNIFVLIMMLFAVRFFGYLSTRFVRHQLR